MHLFGSGWRYALRTDRLGLQVLRGLFSFGSQITQFVAMMRAASGIALMATSNGSSTRTA